MVDIIFTVLLTIFFLGLGMAALFGLVGAKKIAAWCLFIACCTLIITVTSFIIIAMWATTVFA